MIQEKHSAEWWENQANQFKLELDQLQPKLNVAEAKIKELEAILSLVTNEKKTAETESKRLAGELSICQGNLEQVDEARQAAVAQLVQKDTEVTMLRASNERKTAGLQLCLKGVTDQLANIQSAIGNE